MNHNNVFIKSAELALVLLLLTSCSQASNPTPTPSAIQKPPAAVQTPTEQESFSSIFPATTPNPEAMASSREILTPENAADIIQLDYRGRGAISGIAWSPDGSQIAIASPSGLYLLDTLTYKENHFSFTSSSNVAFSPDGQLLASAEGSSINLWIIDNGKLLRTLTGHMDMIYSVAFSPDGKTLISGSQDATVRLWDVASGAQLSVQSGTDRSVYQVAFSPAGKLAASVAYDQKIVLWDVSSGTELRPLSTYSGSQVAFSPAEVIVATAGYAQPIRLWDINSGKELFSFPKTENPVQAMALSPTGKILAYVVDDTSVILWDITSREVLHSLNGGDEYVSMLTFSPDGEKLAAASEKSLKIWHVASGQALQEISEYADSISGEGLPGVDWFGLIQGPVAFSPSGNILAVALFEGPIKLYDIATGELYAQIQTDIGTIQSIAFSPDGKLLAAGGGHYTPTHLGAQVWDVSTQEERFNLSFNEKVWGVAFSPDSTLLATAWGQPSWSCGEGSVKLWDMSSGEAVSEYRLPGKGISGGFGGGETVTTLQSVVFSPDGTLMAGINACGLVGLWDLVNPSATTTLTGTLGYGYAVDISPDGTLLATGGSAGNTDDTADLRLWDLDTGKLLFTLEGHSAAVRQVRFSPNSRLLATSAWDGTVRLWDVSNGKALAVINVYAVFDVVFSPDGTLLATSGDVVQLWGVPSPKVPALTSILGFGYANDATWSPDGKILAVGTSAGVVLYGARDLRSPKTFHASPVGAVNSLAFNFDSSQLAIAGTAGLSLWNLNTAKEQVFQQASDAFGVAFSPDGKLLAAGSYLSDIQVWELAAGKVVRQLKGGGKGILEVVAFSPDGKFIASASSNRTEGHSDGVVRLWEVSSGNLLVQMGDGQNRLAGLVFSRDGKTLAAGGPGNNVSLWEVPSGKLLKQLEGHPGEVVSVAFSPDGQKLASLDISPDNQVYVWDVPSGKTLATLKGCPRTDRTNQGSVDFNPDSIRLVSACEESGIMIWYGFIDQPEHIFEGYRYPVVDVAFSPDGKMIAAGYSRTWDLEQPSDIVLWQLDKHTEYLRLSGHTGMVNAVAFNPSGGQLASGGSDGTARLWNTNTGTGRIILQGYPITNGSFEMLGTALRNIAVSSLAYSPDGSMLALGGGGWAGTGWLELYDTQTGKLLASLKPADCKSPCEYGLEVNDIAFSPDGTLMATAGGDSTIRVWDVANQAQLKELTGSRHGLLDVAFSPDGKILAAVESWSIASSSDYLTEEDIRGGVLFWDVATGEHLDLMDIGEDPVSAIAFSPNGKILAIGRAQAVELWDIATGNQLSWIETGGVSAIAFSPGGSKLAIGEQNGIIQLYRLPGY